MKYKHIFFDLDKTLWDFESNSSLALSKLFQDYNLGNYFSSADEFIRIYNYNNDLLWENYRNGGITKEDLRTKRFSLTFQEKGISDDALSFSVGEKYMEITPKLKILAPNSMEVLNYLRKKRYQLYILTNGFITTQEKKVRYSKIDHFFIRIFSSEELGINKPKKEFFHWAVSSIHAHKNECLMIGDDLKVDIIGAMNYGIDGAWYNPKKEENDFTPTYNFQDLIELKDIL